MFSCNINTPAVLEVVEQLKLNEANLSLKIASGTTLSVDKRGQTVTITYSKKVEIFRALGLLSEHREKENYYTSQTAFFKMDGVMFDCSRNGVMNLPTAKTFIRLMAIMGLDTLMLYTEDTYEIEEYPYFGYMRGRFTADELRELDNYADAFGIELVPCIQTLAHVDCVLRWRAFYDVFDCDDILLCGEEKTYQLIDAMLRTCRSCFKTKRIHIGMDEAHRLGLGRYFDINGYQDRERIFLTHLDRVTEICKKYDFKPMIWSDMFFSLAFGGAHYPAEGTFKSEVLEKVPEELDLVYWEYNLPEKEDYAARLRNHHKFQNKILFAGGACRWLGYAPLLQKSLYQSANALRACKENQVDEVFVTAWGDNGNESSFFVILPVMQQFAEYSYCDSVSAEYLEKRLYACTGEHFDDFILLDAINRPNPNIDICSEVNPGKYLLYQDIMGGLAQRHVLSTYPEAYGKAAVSIKEAAGRSTHLKYVFDALAILASILELKSGIGPAIKQAYEANDREKLANIANQTLPEMLERAKAFHAAIEYQWMKECKVFGYEVLDLRLAGVETRIKTARKRILAYLNNDIASLDELSGETLSINCFDDDALAERESALVFFHKTAFTASNL